MVGFYWYWMLTTKPLTRYPWKKIKLHICPLQEHPVPVAIADHRCRSLVLLHLPQLRISRMKLPADFRFDNESWFFKPISNIPCCFTVERPEQTPLSPKTDTSHITGKLQPTSNNPTKGIQEHQPDKILVKTPPVKAPTTYSLEIISQPFSNFFSHKKTSQISQISAQANRLQVSFEQQPCCRSQIWRCHWREGHKQPKEAHKRFEHRRRRRKQRKIVNVKPPADDTVVVVLRPHTTTETRPPST
jgi:hypothetical protein